MKKTVVIIGPAHPFRGGLAAFDEQLARAFTRQGYTTVIYTFSLQYPEFIFPGATQYSDKAAPEDITILQKINTVNPLNWLMVGNELKKAAPGIVVVRFWLPLMGPALGSIIRLAKKNRHTKVIAITDNVIPHEKRIGDTVFTRYFLKACDAFITMSDNVLKDLRTFEPVKPAASVLHPLYNNFGSITDKEEARRFLHINSTDKVLLFFGFIRRYKGLDLLLEALKLVKNNGAATGLHNIKLLIAGEFYEDEKGYLDKIQQLGIGENVLLKTGFIPEEEVKYYFGAADVVVQPYRNATQSGVTPLAYHFEKPMIVTNVGALPDYVPHEKVGLVTAPDPQAIADAIVRYFQLGEQYFIPHLRNEKGKYSWEKLVLSITGLVSSQ